MLRYLTITGALILCAQFASGQIDMDRKLALEFYNSQEYEKAAVIYEKLLEREPDAQDIYRNYYRTLLALENWVTAEKMIRKRVKRNPSQLTLRVDLGFVYAKQGAASKANDEYSKAVNLIPRDKATISQLASAFVNISEFDLAIQTYKKGRKLLGSPYEFSFEVANVYSRMGNIDAMMDTYLDYLEVRQKHLSTIKGLLQNAIQNKQYQQALQSQLYKRIQKNPEEIVFPEMLVWSFMQVKDFGSALVQVKALDKRFRENGKRILSLARIAHEERDFETAIKAYQYLINTKSPNIYELTASMELLNTRKDKITYNQNYTPEDLTVLDQEYETMLAKYGRNMNTAELISGYADLQANYLHNIPKAIELVQELIGMRSLPRQFIGRAKLQLGDYYLIQGEHWESTLLYSQVDKAFKDDPLGEEGRFKNAKLSYYMGDFEWAQAQLEVLQSSTSELIANDAIDLFVFIQDHLALDTIVTPMMMFADADLLAYQNKNNEAFQAFEDLKTRYPGHTLTDDVLFAQARILARQRKYGEAAASLQEILDYYGEEVLADDAIFMLADIYETRLNNKEKAQDLFQAIILEHSGSTWVIEARKRFRKLRGDKLN